MTIEQRKKQLQRKAGIAVGCALTLCIIGVMVHHAKEDSNLSFEETASVNTGGVIESTGQTETSTVPTESEPAESVPPVLDVRLLRNILVEAGAQTMEKESFFSEYDGQELEIVNPLTPEELQKVGESYKLEVRCDSVPGEVNVTIVDTTPPVIAGAKNRTVYLGASVSYRKDVTVTDNSGETIALVIDSGAVDTTQTGTYPVIYSATDSSGNTQSVEIVLKVVNKPVIDEEYVRPMVEKIVNEITNDKMTEWEKAWKMYKWIHSNITYIGTAGDRSSVWTGAYDALEDRKGDCFVYYALYSVMLDIVGIPNMQVARVGGTSNHWWNLVNLGDGWYHCDASPRRKGDSYRCFMQTDAQIAAYTESYTEKPNYYTFDSSLLPERGTEIVYDGGKMWK